MLFIFQSRLEFGRADENAEEENINDRALNGNVRKYNTKKQMIQKFQHSDLPCAGTKAKEEFVFKEIIPNIFLYSSYWDTRHNDFDNKENATYVRVMAVLMSAERTGPGRIYCLFEDGQNLIQSNMTVYEMCENHKRRYGGYILSCKVPEKIKSRPCWKMIKEGRFVC